MKRFLIILLSLVLVLPLFIISGCGKSEELPVKKITMNFVNEQGVKVADSITGEYLTSIKLPELSVDNVAYYWYYGDKRLATYSVVNFKEKEVNIVVKYFCIVTFQLEEGVDFVKKEVKLGDSLPYEEIPKPPHIKDLELDYVWPYVTDAGIENITSNMTIVANKKYNWSPTV